MSRSVGAKSTFITIASEVVPALIVLGFLITKGILKDSSYIHLLSTGSKKKEKQSDGNKNKIGNQGSIEGDINSSKYEGGGIGIDGEAYQLLGRSVAFKARPIYKVQLEGKVVVDITVDQLGNVVNARI